MKKVSILIISLILTLSLNAQSDIRKNIVKFQFDVNTLVKGDGFDFSYIGFERTISQNSSLILWLGYDFNSSNLKINNKEEVVNSQKVKSKFSYHYFFSKEMMAQGFYSSLSVSYGLSMVNSDNEKNHESGIYLGLGYQRIWKYFVINAEIDKGYTYSTLKNDNIKFTNSSTRGFNFTLSVGYNF